MKRIVLFFGVLSAFALVSAGSPRRSAAHTPSAPTVDCESKNGGSQPESETADSDGDGVQDSKDPAPFDKGRSTPCATANKPAPGTSVTIPIEYDFSDKPYGLKVRYDMTATTDKNGKTTYTANVKVNLTGDRDAAREAKWKKCAEELWSQGDVKLKLDFVSTGGYQTVKINAGDGRSNAGEWFAGSPTFDCNVVNHEVAHLMGIPDEYCDSADPTRWIGEKDSIMRVVWNVDGKPPRTTQRQFDRVIADYQCPPASGQKAFDKATKPGWFDRLWDRVVAVAETIGRAAVASRYGYGYGYGYGMGPFTPTGPVAGANVGRFDDTRGGVGAGGSGSADTAVGAGMAGALGRD